MSAKSIMSRYLVRTREHLPLDPLELREHLASVAERDGLKVTEEELDEMAETGNRKPETGDKEADSAEWRRENLSQKTEAEPKGKRGANKKADRKSGDSTKKEI